MECTSKLILFRKFRQKCLETNFTLDTYRQQPSAAEDRDLLIEFTSELTAGDAVMISEAEVVEVSPQMIPHEETRYKTEEVHSPAMDESTNDMVLDDDFAEYLQEDEPSPSETMSNDEAPKSSVDIVILHYDADEKPESTDSLHANDDQTIILNLEYLDDLGEECASTTHINGGDQGSLAQRPVGPKSRTTRAVAECDLCGAHFSRKGSLAQHMLGHTGVKQFSCAICMQEFTRKQHLVCHMRIHLDHRPFGCPQCDKSFVKASDMERHRAVHSNDRPFFCTLCDKRFKRTTDVTTHMWVHTGRKPYRCRIDPACEKSYSSHSMLKKHMVRVHPGAVLTKSSDGGWVDSEGADEEVDEEETATPERCWRLEYPVNYFGLC